MALLLSGEHHGVEEFSACLLLVLAEVGTVLASLSAHGVPANKVLGALAMLSLMAACLAALSWVTSRDW